MPYVNIRVTRENGTPTAEQKAELIKGCLLYTSPSPRD